MTTNLADSPTPLYSDRVGTALKLAADAFTYRLRKGSQVPYLTHLLAVTSLVMDYGGTEEQIVAAALHDLLEDIDDDTILQILNRMAVIPTKHEHLDTAESVLKDRFGFEAINIILALSDSTTPGVKVDWTTRKRAYVKNLRLERGDVKLVCAADKIHNMQSIVRDFNNVKIGLKVFDRFGDTTVHDHLWYYNNIVQALCFDFEHPITLLLKSTFRELGSLLTNRLDADVKKSCAWERP